MKMIIYTYKYNNYNLLTNDLIIVFIKVSKVFLKISLELIQTVWKNRYIIPTINCKLACVAFIA